MAIKQISSEQHFVQALEFSLSLLHLHFFKKESLKFIVHLCVGVWWFVFIDNSTHSGIIWERNLNAGLSRIGYPVGVSVEDFLGYVNWGGKICTLWAGPFPTWGICRRKHRCLFDCSLRWVVDIMWLVTTMTLQEWRNGNLEVWATQTFSPFTFFCRGDFVIATGKIK